MVVMRSTNQAKMSQSQLPPVENGAEEEREEDADAAEELHKAAKETLQRRNLKMNKGKGKKKS